jgi:hypothetical protein
MSRRSHHRGHRGSRPNHAAHAPQTVAGTDPAMRPEAAALPGGETAPVATPLAPPDPAPEPPIATATAVVPPPLAELAPAEHVAPSLNGSAPAPMNGVPHQNGAAGATAAQLRRFIKSRTWVPMHELRRRFGINGAEDDVTAVRVDGGTIYVGLPDREGQLLGELLRGGDIGYELSVDPASPIVVGVYPMRPVPRH